MNYRELNGKTIKQGFLEFHKKNPHIYQTFEDQVMLAVRKGRTKLSAKLIINWIRWNEYLRSTDQSFKINDAYQSYYARLFNAKHPELDNLFELRKLRNEEEGPYMNVNREGQVSFLS